jgi:hypothetical protein
MYTILQGQKIIPGIREYMYVPFMDLDCKDASPFPSNGTSIADNCKSRETRPSSHPLLLLGAGTLQEDFTRKTQPGVQQKTGKFWFAL